MKRLKYLFTLLLLTAFSGNILAQPSPVKKAAKSMFKITTFDAGGNILHTGYGVFVDIDGTCLGSWEPFVGASSASVIDVQGRKYEVDCLIGGNEIYNVSKFRVTVPESKKMAITPISIASSKLNVGDDAWFVEYDLKNPAIKKYSPTTIETFADSLAYYIFEETAPDELAGTPFLSSDGQLLGLMQPAKKRTDIYCPSALFAMSMTTNGFTGNNATMRQSSLRVALPTDFQQALLAMMMAQGNMESNNFLPMTNEFISLFPNAYEGYATQAEYYSYKNDVSKADDLMTSCIEKSGNKEEAHYAYSRMIYNRTISAIDTIPTVWTLDKAMNEIDAAYAINPQPVYTMHKGKILFAQKKMQEAYNTFIEVSKTNMRSAECFYNASLCVSDNDSILAMLDSALACFETPYKQEAAPYLILRAQRLNAMKQYRRAVNDYNTYEQLMQQYVNANFYYIREQTELNARLYQLALNDIEKAVQMDPNESLYLAEKALLLVRVNHLEEAKATAQECIDRFSEVGDGYAILGIALAESGKKKEAIAYLQKAKELGSEMAEPMLEKYSK